jgi:hypothetical protein
MFDDDLKTMMFFLMVGGFFLLAYGISNHLPRAERPMSPPEPEPKPEPPREAREPGSHYDPHINPDLVITHYNFRSFQADAGPPDPEEFYDELVFQAYTRRDGYRFTGSMMVATPRGLAAELKNGHAYLEGDGTVIVPRYDLTAILRALIERHTDPAELHAKRWQERPVEQGE